MAAKTQVTVDIKANIEPISQSLNTLETKLKGISGTSVGKSLTSDINKLKKEIQGISDLTRNPLDSKGDFEKTSKRLTSVNNHLDDLKSKLIAISNLSADDRNKLFSPDEVKTINDINNAIDNYKNSLEKVVKADAKVVNANKKLAEAQAKQKKILVESNKNSDAEKTADKEYKAYSKNLEKFKKKYKEYTDYKNSLNTKTPKKQQQDKLSRLSDEANSLASNLGYQSAESANRNAEGRGNKLASDLEKVKQKAQESKTALNEVNQEVTNLQTKAAEVEVEVKDEKFQNFLTTLQTEFNKLDSNIDLSNVKDLDELNVYLEECKKSLDEVSVKKISELQDVIANSDGDIATATQKVEEFREEFQRMDEAATTLDNFKNKLSQLVGVAGSVTVLRKAISNAVDTIKELDATMTETAVVTDFSVGDMWDQLPEYTKRASELGVAINDVYESATLYYQQGLKTEEVTALSNATLKMARIAGLDAADATDRMTAALRGFNMEINETNANNVADVYSELAAITASDVDEISTAMSKVASLANSANMSFENTAAFLSQIIETTRESAETAGTALKTVVARFAEVKTDPNSLLDVDGETASYNKIDTALKSVGISLDAFMEGEEGLDQVFIRLAEKWDTLSTTTQRYIATQAAGSRQQSRFIALMSDYARTQELVAAANNAAGASNKQYAKTLESLQTKLNKLRNAWDSFSMGIAESELVKGAVDSITWIIEGLNKLNSSLDGVWGSLVRILEIVTTLGAASVFTSGLGGIFKGEGFLQGAVKQTKGFSSALTSLFSTIQTKTIDAATGVETVVTKLGFFAKGGAFQQGITTAGTALANFFTMGTAGAISFTAALGWVSAAIIAIVVAIALIKKAIKNNYLRSATGQLEQITNQLDEQTSKVNELQEVYNQLGDTLDSLDEKTNALNNLTEGSQEWRDAVKEINEEMNELIDQYDLIEGQDYSVDKNGVKYFTSEQQTSLANKAESELNTQKQNQAYLQYAVEKLEPEALREEQSKTLKKQINTDTRRNNLTNSTVGYNITSTKKIEQALENNSDAASAIQDLKNQNTLVTEETQKMIQNFYDEYKAQNEEANGYLRTIASSYVDEEKGEGKYSEAKRANFLEDKLESATQSVMKAMAGNTDWAKLYEQQTDEKVYSAAYNSDTGILKVETVNDQGEIQDPKQIVAETLAGMAATDFLMEGGGEAYGVNSYTNEQQDNIETEQAIENALINVFGQNSEGKNNITNYQADNMAGLMGQSAGGETVKFDFSGFDLETMVNANASGVRNYDGAAEFRGQLGAAQTWANRINNLEGISDETKQSLYGRSVNQYVGDGTLTDFSQFDVGELTILQDFFTTNTEVLKEIQAELQNKKESNIQATNDYQLSGNMATRFDEAASAAEYSGGRDAYLQQLIDDESKLNSLTEETKEQMAAMAMEVTAWSKANGDAVTTLDDESASILDQASAMNTLTTNCQKYLSSDWTADDTVTYLNLIKNAIQGNSDALLELETIAGRREFASYLESLTNPELATNLSTLFDALPSGFSLAAGTVIDANNDLLVAINNALAQGLIELNDDLINSVSAIGYNVAITVENGVKQIKSLTAVDFTPVASAVVTPTTSSSSRESSKWSNPLEKHYNLLKKITKQQDKLNKLQHKYTVSTTLMNGTRESYSALLEKEQNTQKKEYNYQLELRNGYQKDLEKAYDKAAKNKNLQKYLTYDKKGKVTGFNETAWENSDDKINADSATAEALDELYDAVTDAEEGIESADQTLMDIEEEVADNARSAYDTYADLLNETIDMLIAKEEESLDLQEAQLDAEQEANSLLISTLRTNFAELRQARDNEKTEKSINKMAQRLEYLRQDTSGNNAAEILALEEQLSDSTESYTDTLIDQGIDKMEEAYNETAEYQDKMLEWKRDNLEWRKENGKFQSEAVDLMKTLQKGPVADSDWMKLYKDINSSLTKTDIYTKTSDLKQATSEINSYLTENWTQSGIQKALTNALKDYKGNSDTNKNEKKDSDDGNKSNDTSGSGTKNTGATKTTGTTITYDAKAEAVQNYLIDKYGKKVVGSAGADGLWGSDSQTAAKKYLGSADLTTAYKNMLEEKAKAETQLTKKRNDVTDLFSKGVLYEKEESNEKPITANQIGYAREGNEGKTMPYYTYNLATKKYTKAKKGITLTGENIEIKNEQDGYFKVKNKPLKWFKKSDLAQYFYCQYKQGGLADFTGPAWLDGTKSNPEIVLNAKDSDNFIQLRDILRGLLSTSTDNGSTMGDSYFDIDINIDSVHDSYDISKIADDVKYEIYKDAQYRNINNVSTLK